MPRLPSAPARLPHARRGGVVMIVALSLVVLLGFMALVVDLGYARLVRAQVQMNAEAAALAATMQLDGTDEGLANAIAAAQTYGERNPVAGGTVHIGSGELETGVWDGAGFSTSTDAAEVNAVRVMPKVEGVAAFFGRAAWGQADMTLGGDATTMRVFDGAGGVGCYLPIAIPSCLLDDYYDLDTVMMADLKLSSANVDQVGWARVAGHPSASWVRGQILDCESDGEVVIGDEITLDNGVKTSALKAMGSVIGSSDTAWDEDLWGTQPARMSKSEVSAATYGNTFEGPILVFEDDAYCATAGGGSFTGTEVVSGFVWGAVYDVGAKSISLRLDTQHAHDYGTRAEGPEYGVRYAGSPTFVN